MTTKVKLINAALYGNCFIDALNEISENELFEIFTDMKIGIINEDENMANAILLKTMKSIALRLNEYTQLYISITGEYKEEKEPTQ